MAESFASFQSGAAPMEGGEDETSWLSRNKGLIAGAAAAGAGLLLRRPIGAALAGSALEQFGRGVKGVLAPTAMGEGRSAMMTQTGAPHFSTPEMTTAKEAEALIRSHMGRAARATDQATAELTPHWKELGLRPLQDKEDLVHYVETRSAGGRISDPKLQPAADAIRKSYERVRSEMETFLKDKKGAYKAEDTSKFITDYYRHLYKPKAGESPEQFLAKVGNASFTKQRRIPTIREAKALGYEPITSDPIEMTMRYVQNAEKYIAREKILKEAENNRLVYKTNIHNYKVPPGWQEIFRKGPWQYYAPEGFARVWNNYTSRGFTGAMGDVYRPLQHGFNMMTGLELGLSGFHATTMANESIVSETARAVQQAFKLDPKAFKTLVRAPLAPRTTWKRGKDLEAVWLGQVPGTDHMRRIVNLMERSGGRAKPYLTSEEYSFSGAGSYFEAAKRGALKLQMEADKAELATGRPMKVLGVLGKNLGRVFDSAAEPLFKWYIPRLKNGAFYETMSTWLEHNPMASTAEQERAARMILDSIDNRFGEVIHDNIFWDKTLKQAATLMMRSYSWNLGTIREIAGGAADIARGDFNSPRAAYVIALPLVFGMTNAVYQFLKTGQAPQSEQDLVAPRTGGTDAATGLPERLAPVGYMKDVFGWWKDPVQEAKNKIASGPAMTMQLATGQDWKGDPISPPDADVPTWLKAYAQHITSAFTPISVKNAYERRRDTGVSRAEAFMGLQPAGRQFVDPEGYAAALRKRAEREWQRKVRYDVRKESYYEGTE